MLLAVGAWLTWDVSRAGRTSTGRHRPRSITAELRIGFDHVRMSPLMRLIAVAYVLFAILFFSVSYPFLTEMTAAFPAEADLATALGLFSAATTAVSFLVAVLLANRLFARFGIAAVALVLPVVYLAGFGVWLVRFGLATAVGFRFVQQVTQRGVSNAAWSAFYNVVPSDRRAQVLAFMDGVPGQLGIALAGLLLLAAGDLLSQTTTFVLGAVAAVALTWVVVRIRGAYADSLLRTLREGLARAAPRRRAGSHRARQRSEGHRRVAGRAQRAERGRPPPVGRPPRPAGRDRRGRCGDAHSSTTRSRMSGPRRSGR